MFALILGVSCWLEQASYLQKAQTFQDWDQDGFTPNDGDCDDANPMIHPEADEICDGVDNDCNAIVDDEPTNGTLYYFDSNNDGCTDDSVVLCAEDGAMYLLEPTGC